MADTPAPTPNAERNRRLRERRRCGIRVVPVEVSREAIERAIEQDILSPRQAEDLEELARTFGVLLDDALDA
jgi:hypothetical protein